jgi:hypothetical protein
MAARGIPVHDIDPAKFRTGLGDRVANGNGVTGVCRKSRRGNAFAFQTFNASRQLRLAPRDQTYREPFRAELLGDSSRNAWPESYDDDDFRHGSSRICEAHLGIGRSRWLAARQVRTLYDCKKAPLYEATTKNGQDRTIGIEAGGAPDGRDRQPAKNQSAVPDSAVVDEVVQPV